MDTKILIGIATAFLKGLSAVLMVGGMIQNFTNLTTAKHLPKASQQMAKNPQKTTIFGLLYLWHSANHGSLHL